MARFGIKTKKKRPPTRELSRLKEQLHRLTEKLASRDRELAEALEQQTATSEIMRMIAAIGTNLQSVIDAIAPNAAELCDALDAVVWRVDGKVKHALHNLARSDAASSRGER
jgi:hypothetical protein